MMQAWLPISNRILLYISKKQFLIRLHAMTMVMFLTDVA